MIKWKTNSKEVALENEYMKIFRSEVEMPDGATSDYFYFDDSSSVLIIPIKANFGISEHKYVMVRQYRYPADSYDLEFPAGKRKYGESILDAALRELKEETGYSAKEIKVMYSMYSNPAVSTSSVAVCLAIVEDQPSELSLDHNEEMSGFKVEEFTSQELHNNIISMDITEPQTLAAICLFTMNAGSATEYLNGTRRIDEKV
jgi:ADP-ribose pyrophosphatase